MAVSRAALSREIAEHPGRPIWAATDTISGDLICCAWRRLRGSSPVASAVRSSRFGWVYVHVLGVASVPAFPRRRIWQMPGAIAAAFLPCGQVSLSMWAVPQAALILPAQGQTCRPHRIYVALSCANGCYRLPWLLTGSACPSPLLPAGRRTLSHADRTAVITCLQRA
jgi:hypothetical protein